MKVNDILVSSHGYNCTFVDFYRVKRVTKSSVWLQHLENKWDYHDGYGQVGRVLPSDRETSDQPFMRRIKVNHYCNDQEYVMISDYACARIWDGKSMYYNSLD